MWSLCRNLSGYPYLSSNVPAAGYSDSLIEFGDCLDSNQAHRKGGQMVEGDTLSQLGTFWRRWPNLLLFTLSHKFRDCSPISLEAVTYLLQCCQASLLKRCRPQIEQSIGNILRERHANEGRNCF